MTANAWTRWPSREALSRTGLTRARRLLAGGMRAIAFGILVWSATARQGLNGWQTALALVGVCCCGAVVWGAFRTTLEHRLWPSMGLLTVLVGMGWVAEQTGFRVPALVLWCGCVVTAVERTPLVAALPFSALSLTGFGLYNGDTGMTNVLIGAGMVLAGYVLRLDAEARGSAQRLLAQERAARKAEGESAALAERARIAREIHDVLAHSLSAQLVHLEAARLLIERGAPREQILERVVGARRMARDGLAETRQALSALRGEISPLEDFLRELVSAGTAAEVTVTGDRRPLPAEASQAVRRVAQEALTNARKHAPGAKVAVHLSYGKDDITLAVKDSGGTPGELAGSGGGYGLRGMKERAELLGGTLAAGPYEEGFAVTLKVPA
ncbi:two-component sensor histidine kinase [Streptomyces sulfonofaciens]|uniref:histidine kinase n=1 Tax=Streptomyces sulfonofaciens TaxID=68272 RepID=A0A919L8Q2_9ACTN|nr:histidine kinase [Streptomyces sulfonofaciens]GHH88137.1 two-component sensor histidine kinase [Streptomyces sulfonofaciens]